MKKVVTMKNTTVATQETINPNQKQFEYVLKTGQTVGGKKFVYVPLELLFVDEDIQRSAEGSKNKIKTLVAKWDPNKMDALKVSMHPEECRFSIINGMHRYHAAKIKGIDCLICEVLDLSYDPAERKIQEATIFATQNDEVDTLSPAEKHKANVVRGVKENVELQQLIEKYGIKIKNNGNQHGTMAEYLTGFSEALGTVRSCGKGMMDDIFHILTESKWNLSVNGLGHHTIRPLRTVLKLHPEHKAEIISQTIKFFKPIEPKQFFADAMSAYPERSLQIQKAMYLEDYLCKVIGMTAKVDPPAQLARKKGVKIA